MLLGVVGTEYWMYKFINICQSEFVCKSFVCIIRNCSFFVFIEHNCCHETNAKEN